MFSRETVLPKLQAASLSGGSKASSDDDMWVTVAWMPHSSLSQTSHVTVAIRSVHAVLDAANFSTGDLNESTDDWRVVVSVHGMAGLALVPVPTSTCAAPVIARAGRPRPNEDTTRLEKGSLRPSISKATHDCYLDEVLHIPIRWRDLPRDAYLAFEVLDKRDSQLYRSTMPLFDAHGRLQTGLQRTELTPCETHDCVDCTRNPGLAPPSEQANEWDEDDPVWKASRVLHELERFDTAKRPVNGSLDASSVLVPSTSEHDKFGEIQSVPWLDNLTKHHCQNVLIQARNKNNVFPMDEKGVPSFLIMELPVFEVTVMHEETHYPPQSGASGSITALDVAIHRKATSTAKRGIEFDPIDMVPFVDYESESDNPVEDKYRTLAHDLIRGLVDPALKPDREQRDRLESIIASPSHHLTREEKDLLWRFRFSLVDNRRALTKFLLAVDWTEESEVVQAAELLEQWRKRSPIEVSDALKLLGKHVAFQTSLVREYAIDTLAAAPDVELRLYLLQLVQALKFETVDVVVAGTESSPGTSVSSLARFLIDRASMNIELANYFYWYLKVELHDPAHGARYSAVFNALKEKLSHTAFADVVKRSFDEGLEERSTSKAKDSKAASFMSIVDSVSKLGSSLRHADHHSDSPEASIRQQKQGISVWEVILAQDRFVSGIMNIQMKSRDARGKRDAKEVHLKELLSSEGYDRNRGIRPVPLPTAPHVLVNGVNPQSAKVFKSALYPALIEFHVDSCIGHHVFGDDEDSMSRDSPRDMLAHPRKEGGSYKVIVKTGDDLRQDQLVIMMIQLMDGLLKRATLDLCLRPYSIIATSPSSGLVEFVGGSIPISQVLANYSNSIMHFFRTRSPQKGAKYDVRPQVISTYVRSCAGYCVITYILGVGDRHLDNIMLRHTGEFFHIDYGFIFGRDPKPLPPLFRLTREMVDGMGGLESSEYRQFCSLACQAFNTLRKSAGLILNLLHLMSDAGIEDLSNNPSSDAEGVISRVEERFKLELTDEQAERFFLGLINDSLAALAPRVMDVFHSLAVARR